MNYNEQTWRANRTWVIWLLDVVGFVLLAGFGLGGPEAWDWPGWSIPLTLIPLAGFLAWRVPLTFDQFRGAMVTLAVATAIALLLEQLDTPWKELALIGLIFWARTIFQLRRPAVAKPSPVPTADAPKAPDEVAAD